jgi:hypothetical protein
VPFANGGSIGNVDSFTYTIRNASSGTSTATLNIRIDSPNLGLSWDEEFNSPVEHDLLANDDAAVAVINSGNLVTQGGPHSATSAIIDGSTFGAGPQVTTQTTFTIGADELATVRFRASSDHTGNSAVTVKIVGSNGYTRTLSGNQTAIDKLVSDLPEGTYTVTATYSRTSAWWLTEQLSLKVDTVSITHLDSFVASETTAVHGNLLVEDHVVSSFVKFEIDSGNAYVQVSDGLSITGEFGILTIWKNGNYSYKPYNDLDSIGVIETFTYRLVHPNGFVSVAEFEIAIEHGTGPYNPPQLRSFFIDDVLPNADSSIADDETAGIQEADETSDTDTAGLLSDDDITLPPPDEVYEQPDSNAGDHLQSGSDAAFALEEPLYITTYLQDPLEAQSVF